MYSLARNRPISKVQDPSQAHLAYPQTGQEVRESFGARVVYPHLEKH